MLRVTLWTYSIWKTTDPAVSLRWMMFRGFSRRGYKRVIEYIQSCCTNTDSSTAQRRAEAGARARFCSAVLIEQVCKASAKHSRFYDEDVIYCTATADGLQKRITSSAITFKTLIQGWIRLAFNCTSSVTAFVLFSECIISSINNINIISLC